MKGIVPPSPMKTAWLPRMSLRRLVEGALEPGREAAARSSPGGLLRAAEADARAVGRVGSSARFTAAAAFPASQVGGRRSESLSAVTGRSTLPALPSAGRPSMPVISSVGRQVRRARARRRRSSSGSAPGTNGKRDATLSRRARPPPPRACARRSPGISRGAPAAGSRPCARPRCARAAGAAIRKLEGTMPLASPEWTPSSRISTRSSPAAMPRSEVVHQSRS